MIIAIPLAGRVKRLFLAFQIVAQRTDATRYQLCGDGFSLAHVTCEQALVLPDTVEIEEGGTLTDQIKAQALPLESFIQTTPESAISDLLGLLLRAAVREGKITDAELLRAKPALQNRIWQPSIKVEVGDVYAFGDELWRCEKAHTAQGDTTPDQDTAHWHRMEIPIAGTDPVMQTGDERHV